MPLDPRILRVGITINDDLRIFEGMAISCQGAKYASATQNETIIKIANLDKEARDFLATEGTPFNRIRQQKRQKLYIEAGRESTGASRVFMGDITLVNVSQPPDIWMTIRAITSQFSKGDIITTSEGPLSTVKNIAAKAASALGLGLQFEADDKQIANYGYTGSAAKQINKIADLADVDTFVDDDKLVIKNKNTTLKGTTRIISADTGMVGIPEFTDFGVKIRFLFDIKTKVGDEVLIDSKIYPAANGKYEIFKLNFDLSSRDTPFYYVAETRRGIK